MAQCECPNDCCPEVVPVTLEQNSFVLDSGQIDITLTQVSGTVVGVAIQVQDSDGVAVAANFPLLLWFVDNPVLDANDTLTPPPDPGVARWNKITDANGQLAFNVENAGATDTWYLNVSAGVGVTQSAAITIGV